MEIGEEALETLAKYHWPGNVRELKNVIERVLILNPRALRIERKHLPPLTHKVSSRTTRGVFHPAAGARCLRARLHPEES